MRRLPVLLLAATLVTACAGTPSTPTPSTPIGPVPTPSDSATAGGIELAMANGVAHLASSPADASSAGSAVNAFGLDLYARIRDEGGNMVISPASVAIALAMARAGARGATASEMDAVLHGLAADGRAAWVASLDNALNDRSGSFDDQSGKPQTVTLRVTNGSFVQQGLTLQPSYLDALAAQFGTGVELVDFKQAAEAARSLVNGWVSDQTEQRIKELLGQGTVDAMTRLILVNAIYLKAPWLTPFEVEATQPGPFLTSAGTSVTVPFMHSYGSLEYASGAGWQAVQLPYVGRQLAMLVIVPDSLASFERQFDAAGLDAITGGLASREVDLSLPRFGTQTSASLGDLLAQLGMPSALDASTADFSGITTEERLFISAVVHQANIDVDEAGTEAAAATAVVMAGAAAPSETVTLKVDRPFVFAVRDLETGAVLFLGRIVDASDGAPAS